jgi:hypothetical protein
MKGKSIFEEDFLNEQLKYFRLSNIDGLVSKKEILNDWIQSFKLGKLENSNETAIGTDFINDIFGDILGFNYRNYNCWNLEKELKTIVDGQKPDGAIGYFKLKEELARGVYGIIELKDANTDLDKKQNRSNDKRTPVEQAFSYAPKYGDKCRWVIVSNFIEIRLYQADDLTKYEVFHLEKLHDELELKRFFFLLQKEMLLTENGTSRLERLIKKNKEANYQKKTNQSLHILDQIYHLLKKFEGLSYVDPNILANARPFSNIDKYVWHYSEFCLSSAEDEIFSLFSRIEVQPGTLIIQEELEAELQKKQVVEYRDKLEFIIKRLNDCLVFRIKCYEDVNKVKQSIKHEDNLRDELRDHAEQLREFSIDFRKNGQVCNCLKCCYYRLDFAAVLKTLKSREGRVDHNTLESAYFHQVFGTNDFKTSYLIYQKIAEQEKGKNELLYFLAKYNLFRLHNRMEHNYDLDDKEEVMESIRSIDLDLILHELDLVDPDRRRVLIDIKDEKIRRKAEETIEEKITGLKKAKASFERNSRGIFPNYTFGLNQPLAAFLQHYSSNYLLGAEFTQYKKVCEKVLRGYLISYSIKEGYYARLEKLEVYHINIIIFDLFPSTVKKLFKDYKINEIHLSETAKNDLLEKTKNFLQSNHGEKFWWEPTANGALIQVLTNCYFKKIYINIFDNLFFLLSRTELEEEECRTFIPTLINFLKVDQTLHSALLKNFSLFIVRHGSCFLPNELVVILKLTFKKQKLNNDNLIQSICDALKNFHTGFQLTDPIFTQKAILNSKENRRNYSNLPLFWGISDAPNKAILEKAFFEELDAAFNPRLYRSLLFEEVIDIDFRDYFSKHIQYINNAKGDGSYKLWKGKPELNNVYFLNFALLIYCLDINTDDPRIKQLTKLCDWQKWLITLDTFDYSKFKPEWILLFDHEVMLKRFGQVPQIKEKIRTTLKETYHPRLAEIFVKYMV